MPLRPRSLARLPGRYRFDEIARLVEVGAIHAGDVIGWQLDRHRIDQRRDQWMGLGQLDRGEATPPAPSSPSRSEISAIWPPRARTSCMVLTVFSNSRPEAARTITGTASSIGAMGSFEPEGADFARTSPC